MNLFGLITFSPAAQRATRLDSFAIHVATDALAISFGFVTAAGVTQWLGISATSVGLNGSNVTYFGGVIIGGTAYRRLDAADFPYTVVAGDYYLEIINTASTRIINIPAATATRRVLIFRDTSSQGGITRITPVSGQIEDSSHAYAATADLGVKGSLGVIDGVAALWTATS